MNLLFVFSISLKNLLETSLSIGNYLNGNTDMGQADGYHLDVLNRLKETHDRVSEPLHDKTNKITCAPNEDSDQPEHPPRLIWVFAERTVILLVLSYGGSLVSVSPFKKNLNFADAPLNNIKRMKKHFKWWTIAISEIVNRIMYHILIVTDLFPVDKRSGSWDREYRLVNFGIRIGNTLKFTNSRA